MPNKTLSEREFELINIVGAKLGSNQRDLSRQLDLSLGMTNMLIHRLIAKGYIRIEQLNKRKVNYILTPKGLAEKMRKSIRYTWKTINSISLIKNRLHRVLEESYGKGYRKFYILGESDFALLVKMGIQELDGGECSAEFIEELPEETDGLVLICRENVGDQGRLPEHCIDLVRELAKDERLTNQSEEQTCA